MPSLAASRCLLLRAGVRERPLQDDPEHDDRGRRDHKDDHADNSSTMDTPLCLSARPRVMGSAASDYFLSGAARRTPCTASPGPPRVAGSLLDLPLHGVPARRPVENSAGCRALSEPGQGGQCPAPLPAPHARLQPRRKLLIRLQRDVALDRDRVESLSSGRNDEPRDSVGIQLSPLSRAWQDGRPAREVGPCKFTALTWYTPCVEKPWSQKQSRPETVLIAVGPVFVRVDLVAGDDAGVALLGP